MFLPSVFVLCAYLSGHGHALSFRVCLVVASLVFYSWLDIYNLPILLISILVNFIIAGRINSGNEKRKFLTIGLLFNVVFLTAFKYANWIVSNVNYLFATDLPAVVLIFPAGISFYTFVQIAYLVDLYRKEAEQKSLLDYMLFVSFFPKLMQGPITRYKEAAAQLASSESRGIDYENVSKGLFLFSLGLFKKVIIADTLAGPVATAFDLAPALDFFESWLALLCYTFQIYFDFSGYTDMALGSALMLNIHLPINFFSPYSSRNIQEFWHRWHITLGHFLRDYIYIPLGGNRKGKFNTYRNLVLTFLIAGLWHGAGWNFVFWGFLHGFGLAVHRMWKGTRIQLPGLLAWAITFSYVCFTWIFFRAQTWGDAIKVLKGCLGFSGFVLPHEFSVRFAFLQRLPFSFDVFMANMGFADREFPEIMAYLLITVIITFFGRNSVQLADEFKGGWSGSVLAGFLATVSILNLHKPTTFVYFNF